MIPLPRAFVEKFQGFLEAQWCLEAGSWSSRRDALMIGLGLYAMRWGEVADLRVRCLDIPAKEILVPTLKGGRNRRIPLGPSFAKWLYRWMLSPYDTKREFRWNRTRASTRVFCTRTGLRVSHTWINERMKKWTLAVIGKEYTFHCLRHTAAMKCYLETKEVKAVQHLLGHRNSNSTDQYLKLLMPVMEAGLPVWSADREDRGLKLFDPDRKFG